MKQRILDRARSVVEACVHKQYGNTSLKVLAVDPEVDGYGDEFLWISLKYDDGNGVEDLPDAWERIGLIGRFQTELQDVDIEAFPVISFIAESDLEVEVE